MLISIIIPTHNRCRYAQKTIESLLSLNQPLEIVIADSSEQDDLKVFLESNQFTEKVKYVRSAVGQSVVDNFNAGFAAATGDYFLFLGDDDFVSNDIFSVAEWAKKNNIDAIKFTFPALYYWPDFRHARRGGAFAGTLRITSFSGDVKYLDAKLALREAARSFGDGPINMPRAYLGLLSRDLTDCIVKKYGALFGGVSPDVYSACLIASEAKKSVIMDFPVVIPGASSASTSGQTAEGKHVGKLRENAHLGAFKNLEWDSRIPEFYSVPTVWSYSLLKAIDQVNLPESQVNYARLFVKCMFYHRHYFSDTIRSLRFHMKQATGYRMLRQLPVALISELYWLAGKAFNRISGEQKQVNNAVVLEGLNDVFQARVAFEKFLEKKKPLNLYRNIREFRD